MGGPDVSYPAAMIARRGVREQSGAHSDWSIGLVLSPGGGRFGSRADKVPDSIKELRLCLSIVTHAFPLETTLDVIVFQDKIRPVPEKVPIFPLEVELTSDLREMDRYRDVSAIDLE